MGSKNNIIKSLYFFDSGRDILDRDRKEYGIPDGMQGYDFLKKEQIDFYKKEVDRLTAQYGKADSFLYFHIPLVEYSHAFKEENGRYVPSGKCEILHGEQYESVGSSAYNSGMFDAILEKGGQAVFCGHDHYNNFSVEYKGIRLTYGMSVDYLAYPGIYKLGTQRGCTIIEFAPDGSMNVTAENYYQEKYTGLKDKEDVEMQEITEQSFVEKE